MSERFSDHMQALIAHCHIAAERSTQVVHSQIFYFCFLEQGMPSFLWIHEVAGFAVTRKDPFACAIVVPFLEDRERGRS